jgi:hypothetical protein
LTSGTEITTIFNGTSAANPNMAGVASLVWSVNPNLTGTQVREILIRTAMDLAPWGKDLETGHGLINADKAVRRALAIAQDSTLAKVGQLPVVQFNVARSFEKLATAALPGNRGAFIDSDGDTYTVRLQGPGQLAIAIDDADGDGKGPIEQIIVSGADPRKSNLLISVKQARGGDGQVSIGSIIGSGLKSIKAPAADLVGAGILLGGFLGSVQLDDVENGADIRTRGGASQKTTIVVDTIGAGSAINLGSSLSSLKAQAVDDATIRAAAIGKLSVRGDFAADVAAGRLTSASIGGDISDAVWEILGDAGKISVKGDVERWQLRALGKLGTVVLGEVNASAIDAAHSVSAFSARTFLNSTLFAGFTPEKTEPMMGKFTAPASIKRFTVTGTKNSQDASFANSLVAAGAIGTARLGRVATDNRGASFGLLADEAIGSVKFGLLDENARETATGFDDFEIVVR